MIWGLQMGMRAPKREHNVCDAADAAIPRVSAEELQGWGWGVGMQSSHHLICQDLAPDSWGAYERTEFSEPRNLNLPIHRRTLNSWIWYLIFDFLYLNTIPDQTDCRLCCKLLNSLTPSPASSGQSLRAPWDAASWAQSP